MNMNKLPHYLSLSLLALAINTPAGAQQSAEPAPEPKQTEDEAARTPAPEEKRGVRKSRRTSRKSSSPAR